MSLYKVEVENTILKYSAPTMYVEAANDNDARTVAKSRSGLGKYDSELGWVFTPHQLRDGHLKIRAPKRGKKQSQKEKAKGT